MKKFEKELKELYAKEIGKSAPDTDLLWDRIEKGLEEKPAGTLKSSETTEMRGKRLALYRRFTFAAAAVAMIISVTVFLNGRTEDADISGTDRANSADEHEQTTVQTSSTETSSSISDTINEPEESSVNIQERDGKIYYEDLFPGTSIPGAVNSAGIVPSGQTEGDDYFVEDSVLMQTEELAFFTVKDLKHNLANREILYTLSYADGGFAKEETVTIESGSEFVMMPGRQYLLPLKTNENGEKALVFENAPQIEAVNGGMIFHNGWTSLKADCEVVYPQGSVDDFFYDRMMFSYGQDIGALEEKWHELRKEAVLFNRKE